VRPNYGNLLDFLTIRVAVLIRHQHLRLTIKQQRVNASGKQLNEGTAANVSSTEWFAGANLILIEIAFSLKEDQQCSKTYVSPLFVFATARAGLSTFVSVSHVAQLGGGRRFLLASFLFQSRIYAPSRHLVFALIISLSQASIYLLTTPAK